MEERLHGPAGKLLRHSHRIEEAMLLQTLQGGGDRGRKLFGRWPESGSGGGLAGNQPRQLFSVCADIINKLTQEGRVLHRQQGKLELELEQPARGRKIDLSCRLGRGMGQPL